MCGSVLASEEEGARARPQFGQHASFMVDSIAVVGVIVVVGGSVIVMVVDIAPVSYTLKGDIGLRGLMVESTMCLAAHQDGVHRAWSIEHGELGFVEVR